ncbi:AbiTii domain-containing protein [Acutalibacter sp. 1XD8-33]|uniref:AbiTii domain-containing protein n=1 Tax=Acutalibacter sp. 1XD8-33 TaxID=2320081 RepID=UPI001313D8FC
MGSTELNQWIKNEIEGYKDLEDIPSYRRAKCCLKGCYIEGGLNCKNLLIPIDNVEEEIIEGLTYNNADQSIMLYKKRLRQDNHL